MSTDNVDPSKQDATISSADDLVKTGKSGDAELSEQELKRVSGGYLKITMNDVIITSVTHGSSDTGTSSGSGTK